LTIYLRDPANVTSRFELSTGHGPCRLHRTFLLWRMKLHERQRAPYSDGRPYGRRHRAVSLPSFDHDRPNAAVKGRCVQTAHYSTGPFRVCYELGSVLRFFTAAQAIDLGIVTAGHGDRTPPGPDEVGGFRIGEFPREKTTAAVVRVSSFTGSARDRRLAARDSGPRRARRVPSRSLGFLWPTGFEFVELWSGKPFACRKRLRKLSP